MFSLFISTYNKYIIIGLLKNGELINKKEQISAQNHSVYTMSMIDDILKENNINTTYLNEIIIVNGPGSFTGVRIGVTIAKTLAYTLNIPIKTITSLEALAVSTDTISNKLITISDLKGKYIGYFNKDNNNLEPFTYLKNDEYNEYIKNKENFIIDKETIDINKIYKYLRNKDSINPHIVNPIYIKGIDALNGK